MVYIIDIDSQKFTLNGIPYLKNFLPHVSGDFLGIVNVYDTKFVLSEYADFSQYTVNGVVHVSALALQEALLPILYTRDSLNGIVQTSPYFNKFTNDAGYTLVGQDFTVNAGWAWEINGNPYSNSAPVVINLPYAATGKHRIDTIVADTNNNFYRVAGVEVNLADSPAEPPPTANTLRLTAIPVNESDFGSIEDPINGVDFRLKKEKSEILINEDNSFELVNMDEKATYRFIGTVETIRGIMQVPSSPLYDGREFTFINDQAIPITLKHNDGLPPDFTFFFPTLTDLILYPRDICKVRYTKIGGVRLELVGKNTDFAAIPGTTDALAEGATNLYFTVARVLATVLTGISFATGGAIVSTDTVLQAFGKIQKQINDLGSTYQAILVSGTNIRTLHGNTLLGSTDLVLKKRQVFLRQHNWTTTTLNRVYYINYNDNAIEFLSTATLHTVAESMTGRNVGMFAAPYDCKIVNITMIDDGSGSYTGKLGIASGLPNYGGTWNLAYSNIIVHLDNAISSGGFNVNINQFPIVGGTTIPKGYKICPTLFFSAQAGALKTGVTIQIEIEEV